MELKIAFLLVMVSISSLFADPSYSQVAKVSLSMENKSLEQVMDEIERQSEFYFIFNQKQIDVNRIVNVKSENQLITAVLPELFKGTNVNYVVLDRKILLTTDPLENRLMSLASEDEQQLKRITGTVSDKNGTPLPAVNVFITGSSQGTSTDMSGKYSIEVPDGARSLTFSFVGMVPQEITIGNLSQIDVALSESSIGLDEVVVIGYGTQKKREVTGAIEIVTAKDMNVATSSSFQQSLQGKAAGVQVSQATGQPGASVLIQLRSNPSFANAGVLYIIDGVPVNDNAGIPSSAKYGSSGVDQSPLNFINPNDIESISFLKDASSASIYGARAGAGVILITTKRGKSGTPKIQYNLTYATQKVDKMYDLLNTKDYMATKNLILQEYWMKQNKIAPYYGTVDPNTVSPFVPFYSQSDINNQPDYQNAAQAIVRSGYIQQQDISISGGNEKTTYFISGNYFDQKGIIINSAYKRYNGRINLDQVISNKIKIGTNIIGSNTISNNIVTGGQNEYGGIFAAAYYYPPTLPLQDIDGSYPLDPYFPVIPNPLSYRTITDITNGYRFLTSAYVEWQIINGLKARGNFSYDQSSNKRSSFYPTDFLYGASTNGLAAINEQSANAKLLEYTLNYNRKLGKKLSLNALAGYSYQLSHWDGINSGNQKFVSNSISYYNLGAGQATTPSVGSYKSQEAWASYFARAILQYDTKYVLQASMRRDGSSKFAQNRKWGYFPSISASWIMTDEQFIKNISVINFLKLRVGYGETGNSAFPGTAEEVYGIGAPYLYGTNAPSTGIYLTQAANPNLTWETAVETNIGMDFGILKNRLSGSVDFFRKNIRNLIAWTPFPSDFIVSGVYSNAGKTRSTGYDISLRSYNIITKGKGGFTWSTNITFSHYLSYWVQRSPLALATLPKYENVTGKNAVFNARYGFIYEGLFTGDYGTAPATMPNMLPGGIIIKDIHGYDAQGNLTGPDGMITAADQTYIGNWDPKFNFGFGNTFTYKGFDLTIFLSGQKKSGWDPYGTDIYGSLGVYGQNAFAVCKDRWTYQNLNGSRPTGLQDLTYMQYQSNSNYFLIDGSYLRCKNITLGYSLPEDLIVKTKIVSALRVTVEFQNLFTITNYPMLDPELNQGNFYPMSKSIVFGLNVTF